jgi:hypothetical protein
MQIVEVDVANWHNPDFPVTTLLDPIERKMRRKAIREHQLRQRFHMNGRTLSADGTVFAPAEFWA